MNIQTPMIPSGMARPRSKGVLVRWFGEEMEDEEVVELVVVIVCLSVGKVDNERQRCTMEFEEDGLSM